MPEHRGISLCATRMPVDDKAPVAAFGRGYSLSAVQIIRNNHGDNSPSSASVETASSNSDGNLHVPGLQLHRTCTISQEGPVVVIVSLLSLVGTVSHEGSRAATASLREGAPAENNLDDVNTNTASEPANTMHGEMLPVPAATSNGDSEVPASKSAGTRGATHAARTPHASLVRRHATLYHVYKGTATPVFAYKEQNAVDHSRQGSGHDSSPDNKIVDSETYCCSGECSEQELSADQRHMEDSMGTQASEKNHACGEKQKIFTQAKNISRSLLSSTYQNRYASNHYTVNFTRRGVMAHTHKNPHVCNDCGKKFAYKCLLTRHMLTHTGEKPHVCSDCGKRFAHKCNLGVHMLTHTHRERQICNECGHTFSQRNSLRSHMLTHTHEKTYLCDECGMRFLLRCALKRHMLTHTGEKPHICDECGQRFAAKGTLQTHMLIHVRKKPHVCGECGRGFLQKSCLTTHMLTHSHEKPHMCCECGQRFSLKSTLKRHVMTHTGEKPHVCSDCGKRFVHKGYLNEHMVIHTNEKPHICDKCGQAFAWKRSLRRHTC